MIVTFILDKDHNVIPCEDALTWAEWFKNAANRAVAQTPVGPLRVSTIFMGTNFCGIFGHDDAFFETAICGTMDSDGTRIVERYPTWAEAVAGHEKWVATTKRELNG